MKIYGFRNKLTGEFNGNALYTSNYETAEANCPEGFELVEGMPPPVNAIPADQAHEIRNRINQVEQQQHRALREFLLNNTDEGRKRLQAIDDEIAQLRAKL